MRKIVSFLYWYTIRRPLHLTIYWAEKLEKKIERDYLQYCQKGCSQCYKWKCSVRSDGETPFRKYRE